jgi:hypothetical protein
LGQKEDLLEVAEVDYAMCENLREDVVSVDRLHADVVSLSTRIRELKNQVYIFWGILNYSGVLLSGIPDNETPL